MKAGWSMSSLRKAGTASTASPPSSALLAASIWPITPPWWLTSQTAAASPWVAQLDRNALVPVNGSSCPKVMVPGLAAAAVPALAGTVAATSAALMQAEATRRAVRRRRGVVLLSAIVKLAFPVLGRPAKGGRTIGPVAGG